ncbi:hypothetical protein, partial [Bradyrhizobium sp. Mp27]|uniref:hypothetical protein n=1 Tax=Bradyrhizobium sp. Mp27 TaxID=3042157 RepID=UPI00248B799D
GGSSSSSSLLIRSKNPRRCQAENPLKLLSEFAGPALNLAAGSVFEMLAGSMMRPEMRLRCSSLIRHRLPPKKSSLESAF